MPSGAKRFFFIEKPARRVVEGKGIRPVRESRGSRVDNDKLPLWRFCSLETGPFPGVLACIGTLSVSYCRLSAWWIAPAANNAELLQPEEDCEYVEWSRPHTFECSCMGVDDWANPPLYLYHSSLNPSAPTIHFAAYLNGKLQCRHEDRVVIFILGHVGNYVYSRKTGWQTTQNSSRPRT